MRIVMISLIVVVVIVIITIVVVVVVFVVIVVSFELKEYYLLIAFGLNYCIRDITC